MQLELLREYFLEGTNGEILHEGQLICKTIELPWKENSKRKSCIPEGKYSLMVRLNEKFGWHLVVLNVPDRKGILFHPANDAAKELKGCIAPVLTITSAGKGRKSKAALKKLVDFIIDKNETETIYLTIAKAV